MHNGNAISNRRPAGGAALSRVGTWDGKQEGIDGSFLPILSAFTLADLSRACTKQTVAYAIEPLGAEAGMAIISFATRLSVSLIIFAARSACTDAGSER